ncbi:PAS domain-containing protein [Atopobacter sp. AH10]|uniref:DHH family phosphoesterase n=1 Tax=Atopobacter sp. AH10 TaxID=2315861 RepID=UPI000EF211AB|nr:DHH family phosphoesterase [Atopobacter sp. AH10]RLK62822.1 PAS domain-containing protein [Atopobacter sp. AH10]
MKAWKIDHLPEFIRANRVKIPILIILTLLFIILVISFFHDWKFGLTILFLFSIVVGVLVFLSEYLIDQTNNYITDLSYRIKQGEQEALIRMPIGIILYNKNGEIQWANPYFKKIFNKKDILGRPVSEISQKLADVIEESEDEELVSLETNHRYIDVSVQKDIRAVFLMDTTRYSKIAVKYKDSRIVFGHIFLDNYDEISQSLSDRRKSNLNNFVTNQLSNWANHHNIYLKRVDDDRFIAVLTRQRLSILENEKFEVIDTVRETTARQNYPLTLSMGFSYADENEDMDNFHDIAQVAQSNLDLALGRGGDQVVVRSKEEKSRFYGGKTNPMEKRTRVRSRMVAQALRELMKDSDQVIVMGHQYPDMDALGSALGIRRIAQMNNTRAYIAINHDELNNDVRKLMSEIVKDSDIAPYIVESSELLDKITPKTLVVLVDVHRPSIVCNQEILEACRQVVVIDHHRRGQEFPENPVLVYLEPYASSAGELVTELFEYQSNEADPISKIEATAILGGIIVDTRNFSLRTGSRTFDAASYLKSCGADTVMIQRLLKEDINTYLLRSELIERVEVLDGRIGIAAGSEERLYNPVVAAQTADTLLSMEDIEASFVITKREDGRIGISARSLGTLNVQTIMELMGGGGHLSNAATQIKDKSVEEVKKELMDILKKKVEEDEED